MKAVKGVLVGVVVLVIIVAGLLFYVFSSLDSIVAAAIEKYGSKATQTEVRVDSVKLALTEGSGAISGLSVGNPPGFSAPNVFTLGNISTKLNIESLGQDPIIVEDISVGAPLVYFEINDQGQSNLKALQDNMASSAPAEPAAKPKPAGDEVRLIIRRLVVEGGKLEAKVAALPDQDRTATLPRIELRNLGQKQGGATGEEIAREVVDELIKQAVKATAKLGVNKYLDKKIGEVTQGVEDKAKEKLGEGLGDQVGERLRGGLDALKNR